MDGLGGTGVSVAGSGGTGSGIFVSPAVDGRDHAGRKRLAQRRDMNLQGVLFDHEAGPHGVEEFGLADHRLPACPAAWRGCRRTAAESSTGPRGPSSSRSARFSR